MLYDSDLRANLQLLGAIFVLMLPAPAWAVESTGAPPPAGAGRTTPGLEELRGAVSADADGAARTAGMCAPARDREKAKPAGSATSVSSDNASTSTGKARSRDDAGSARAKQPRRKQGSTGDQDGINTWVIFGFTEGSDVDEQGGRTVYTDSIGRLSRREANYAALHGSLGYGYSPTDRTNIWIEAVSEYEQAGGVAPNPPGGVASSVAFGTSIGIKHQILDRAQGALGLSVQAAPYWQRALRVDGSGRETVGSEWRVLADVALVPERVFGAVNLAYTPEFNASGREIERTSSLEASAAIAGRVGENLFVGAELRNLTIHDGAFFGKFLGWALYAGPTLYLSLAGKGYVAAAWSEQLVGKAAGESGARLDLINHERHQFRIKTGFYL